MVAIEIYKSLVQLACFRCCRDTDRPHGKKLAVTELGAIRRKVLGKFLVALYGKAGVHDILLRFRRELRGIVTSLVCNLGQRIIQTRESAINWA